MFVYAADEDKALVPADLTGECLAQTWYRLLHSIGNPIQLARPGVVSHTHKFLQHALMNSQVSDAFNIDPYSTTPAFEIVIQRLLVVGSQSAPVLGCSADHIRQSHEGYRYLGRCIPRPKLHQTDCYSSLRPNG